MSAPTVSIHYRRLPDRVHVYEQALLEETPEWAVTFLERAGLPRPVRAGGRTVLDVDAPVVWLTYPGRWYDVGRFHRSDGSFTGWYANLLTPVEMEGRVWRTTDLCLDVWLDADGGVELLDEDELEEAVRRGWLEGSDADAVRARAAAMMQEAAAGRWPPPPAGDWTLERARERLRELRTLSPGSD